VKLVDTSNLAIDNLGIEEHQELQAEVREVIKPGTWSEVIDASNDR